MSYECYMNVTFRFCFRSPLKSLKLPVFKGFSTDLGSHSFLHISFYPLYKEMAIHMGLSAEDVDQMLNLESGASSTGSLDNAYRVLGISPDASNDEVKAAYRKMALKHHPDKVAALGEDVRRAAEKKFQEINDAKDRIYKARGL